MCQNYGHCDSVLDLIIKKNSAADSSASCQMWGRKKTDAERRDFNAIACKSSDLLQNVCVEMEAHQSVFRWG